MTPRSFDHESGVAAVIGREGADLTPDAAALHIAGYVLFCDWSARDLPGEEMKLDLGTVGTGCILEFSRVHGADAYPYLVPGDRVRLEVEGLGAIDAPEVEGAPVHPLRKEST